MLDLDAIAEHDSLVDEHLATDDAIGTDLDASLEPASGADRGPGSDADIGRDVGRRVDAR